MKLRLLIPFTLLTFLSTYSYGQTFNWNDSIFKLNATRDIRITYQLGNIYLQVDSTNYKVLDTIVKFMKMNPIIKVEISNHIDKVDPRCCSRISQERAETIRDTLIKLGISPDRIIAKGWGATKPVISQSQIKMMRTKEEMEAANALNRRTEIVIIEN